MTKVAQSYNFEDLTTIVKFFQLKNSEPSIPFYGFDIPSTALSHAYINENIKTTLNIIGTNDVEALAILGNSNEEKNMIADLDKRSIENHKLIIEKITNKAKTDYLYKSLENLHKECEEDGFEIFDEKARQNAQKILDFLCENFPKHDFDIYPTEDREIDIYNTPGKGRGVLITCDSDGSVAYFKTDDKDTRYRCQDIEDFPFELLCKEIESLRRPKIKLLDDNPTMLPQQNKFKISGVNIEYRSA